MTQTTRNGAAGANGAVPSGSGLWPTGSSPAPGSGWPGGPTGPGGPEGGDPFGPPPARPWYRRPVALVAAVVVVVVGASVVADLPQHATPSQQATTIATVVKSINSDIHPCTYAASEAFSIYRQEAAGTLSAADRAHAPGFLSDDQVACSMTNQSVVQLGTLTLPQTAAGRELGTAIRGILEWESSDAVAAIEDIQTLQTQPGDAAALADLRKQERLLAADRQTALQAIRAASHDLGDADIGTPALPRLPSPS